MLQNVRDLDLSDLLGREPAPVDAEGIGDYLRGVTVLVTGAGGSIGSEISRQVARYQPGRLLLLDRDETLLHDVATGPLANSAETILLDLCDRDRTVALLREARPDVVFHAAAHKHVPILERHPAQAAATNVLSTWWLAKAAAENGCQRFVHLSTDKAAHPCSVMGATKRAAEHVVVGVGRRYDLPCAAVRFGNVLGSRGSVVPTFLRQILDGGPVTVTSEEMTRYFMTIPEAVSLVLQAGAMADGERIFLLDMGEPASILGLARQMIRLAGLRPGDDIPIEITGPRPGERLHERLHDEAEEHEPADHPSISVLRPKLTLDWQHLVRAMDDLERSCREDDEAVRRALMDMLRRCGVDCRLEPSPTGDRTIVLSAVAGNGLRGTDVATGDGTAAGYGAPTGDSTPPGSGLPAGNGTPGRNGAARHTLALLSGVSPDCPPSRSHAQPAPRWSGSCERLTRPTRAGSSPTAHLVRELEERVADRLARRPRRRRELVHLRPDARGAGPGRGTPGAGGAAELHLLGLGPRRCVERRERLGSSSAIRAPSRWTSPTPSQPSTAPAHSWPPTCSAPRASPEAVEKLAGRGRVPVVFDAAHAIGATSRRAARRGLRRRRGVQPHPHQADGRRRGRAGRDARRRISPNGSGSAATTATPGDYDTRFVGLNARMSEFHAAMALESLALLDHTLARRRELAVRYVGGTRRRARHPLAGRAPRATSPRTRTSPSPSTRPSSGIDRDQLVAVLAAEGIDTRNYFYPPVHRQQAYRDEPNSRSCRRPKPSVAASSRCRSTPISPLTTSTRSPG